MGKHQKGFLQILRTQTQNFTHLNLTKLLLCPSVFGSQSRAMKEARPFYRIMVKNVRIGLLVTQLTIAIWSPWFSYLKGKYLSFFGDILKCRICLCCSCICPVLQWRSEEVSEYTEQPERWLRCWVAGSPGVTVRTTRYPTPQECLFVFYWT